MKYINKIQECKINNNKVKSLSTELNLPENIIKLLFSRGIKTKTEIQDFLNCGINQFKNPFLLSGMQEGVNMINDAIKNNNRILIVGDYDTDGICSTAILYKYFESVGVKVNYFLPNRFLDGYGLTIETAKKIVAEFNPELIITVDCGIACHNEIDYLQSLGIKVLVTDHHEIPEIIPNCVCIDPKLESAYPFKEFCGAGVAFKLVQALAGLSEALKYTNIASIATVADIVTLTSENRAIVKHGLENQNSLPVGVKKLISSLKISNLTSTDIAFKIAPKLNTAGRMGDATVAFKLFIEKNPIEIINILTNLEEQNNKRIEAGNTILEDCMQQLKNIKVSKLKAIVLSNENWHSGVLGIVCAKLTEKFNKPVCLLTKVDNVYKGSIRSLKGIDIYKELSKVSPLLVKFGGHSGAGGLTIEENNIEKFREQLNNNISNSYPEEVFEAQKYYDFDLNKETFNISDIQELNLLEPFGFGNEKPVFKYTFNNLKPERLKNYPNFVKFKTDNFEMIGFSLGECFDSLNTNCNKNVILDLNVEVFNKKEKIKATIKHISFEKLNTGVKSEISLGYYAKQLNVPKLVGNSNVYETNETKLNSLINSSFGTLIVCNSIDAYNFALKTFGGKIKNFESFAIKDLTGSNTLLYAPKNTNNFENFEKIIFLNEILHKNYLLNFNSDVYICPIFKGDTALTDLNLNRTVFGIYHNAILKLNAKNIHSFSEQEYFNLVKKQNLNFKDFKFNQFIFVTMVLAELKIIEITNELNYYKIDINKNVNNPLTNSSIYNFVSFYKNVNKPN